MGITMRPGFERRLKRELEGECLFDPFSRGRYATDASIYQMMPLGVVIPQKAADIEKAIAIAREEGVPILARGGGTSQCGQTVNEALVIDNSRHLNKILELDVENRRCVVEPGIVLDDLNRALKPHGLWYPIDVSTASRATIGGMAGNNSSGGRSLKYGKMRDNVRSIDAILADGTKMHFGPVDADDARALVRPLLELGRREADTILKAFPKVQRRVGGYNIDALIPSNQPVNLAHLLVGSEGTLAYSTAIELTLSPLPGAKVMGVCHFPTFYQAMEAPQHLVKLMPQAIELVDATMIALARDIPLFRKTMDEFVRGDPDAMLLVEFAEGDERKNREKLEALEEAMSELGFSWNGEGRRWGGVAKVTDNRLQGDIAEVRKSGLNIMMSMKDAGKPISFVEDCAVELPDLADYTERLTQIFENHGTRGTWYAHASVGCLHVRPVLNMKLDQDVKTMRSIAEQCFEMVKHYKGSHSGEHGDGILRSEFHEKMFGSQMIQNFNEVKQHFDSENLFNPGKIVNPPKMDDRSLFRYSPDYKVEDFETVMDWSQWTGAAGGFQGAVEMCNNNGACRKIKGGVMCPSYRVTRNERDVTRGRANSLRLAISGQLGEGAFTSDEMMEAMRLCVSCKGCKRECPTGVDMARMKIEVIAARARTHGLSLHDKLVGYLPRYAPYASRISFLMNLRNQIPGIAALLENATGFSAKRKLPKWHANAFRDAEATKPGKPSAVLFADTFNRYFEPENLRATLNVLRAGNIAVDIARSKPGERPLCCGRTLLSVGRVEEARAEMKRLVTALLPYAKEGIPVIGLEPSCLLSLRDEAPGLLPGEDTSLVAQYAKMLEEFIVEESEAGRMRLQLRAPTEKVLLHGHCHQKAHGVMSSVEKALELVPDMAVERVETSCCGMAGSFGYATKTHDISMQMGELDLLPAVRAANSDTIVIADGTSCRHQIVDGTGREAIHVARFMEMALKKG